MRVADLQDRQPTGSAAGTPRTPAGTAGQFGPPPPHIEKTNPCHQAGATFRGL